MKKERIIISLICIPLILLGLVFATHFLRAYVSDPRFSFALVFTLLAFAEALFTGLSYYLYLRNQEGTFAIIIYIMSAILTIPVVLCTALLILYFCGLQMIPPPQR